MPRSYRGIVLAFAGLVLAGAQQPAKQAETNSSAQQEQAAAAQTAAPAPTPEPTYRPYPHYNPDPCYQAEDHDTADLCAQWRAALAAEKAAQEARRATNWGIAATFLSFATLGGLIVTIWQTQGALGEARRGNRIAQKANARGTRQAISSGEESRQATNAMRQANDIALNAQRAWVALDIEPQLFQPSGQGVYFRVYFKAINVGKSAATHFEMHNAVFFFGIDGDAREIGEKMERQVECWRREESPQQHWSLAPGDTETDPWWGSKEPPDFHWHDGPFPGQKHTQPIFLSAAFYRTVRNPSVIQSTWRAWYLHTRDRDGKVTSILLEENYKAIDLCTEPFRSSATHEEHNTNDDSYHREE